MTMLLIATRNAHKAQEIQSILGGDFTCRPLLPGEDWPVVVEDADTFAGNAAKKAATLARAWALRATSGSGRRLVLGDDSGLEVDALSGAPGVHSARFAALDTGAAGNSPDADNNAKLLRRLSAVPRKQRTARFRCVLVLSAADGIALPPSEANFEGTCEGWIDFAPRGDGGFGYDPLFIPEGFEWSFAELGEETKNQISHRARALAKLKAWLGEHGF